LSIAEKKDYSGIGGLLILIGGILAVISSVFRLALAFFLRRIILEWIVLGRIDLIVPYMARWILGFMIIGTIVIIILGIIAIYAYTRVKGGKVENGGLIAIIVGAIMLVSMHWIPGIITLIGGVLCYKSK